MRLLGGITAAVGVACIAFAGAIAPAVADGEGSEFNYVALGDSYSAGFGLIPFSGTSPFTATPSSDPNGCYQADGDYPHLVAAALGLSINDQTCSGAITANIGYPADAAIPATPVIDTLPSLPTTPELQTTMSHQVTTQLQAGALSAATDIVTVAIGGNDLGFTDIAEACIRTATGGDVTGLLLLTSGTYATPNCEDYFTTAPNTPAFPADANLQTRMTTLIAPRIDAAFDQIRAAAPNAEVFVVEYPQIADATATDACFSAPFSGPAVPFSGVDIQYIHTLQGWLNDAMESAAAARGFHWIETESSTTNHNLCSADPWIAKLDVQMASGGTCPPNWLPLGYDGNVYACAALGALHPNADGVANLGAVVQTGISSVPLIKAGGGGTTSPGAALAVSGLGFQAGEQVELVLHSTPVTIGTPTASGTGTFTGTFAVPGDVPPGSHTLVATGLTSGRVVSLAVTVQLPATGADPTVPLLLGLCLVTTGFLLVVARRRVREAG